MKKNLISLVCITLACSTILIAQQPQSVIDTPQKEITKDVADMNLEELMGLTIMTGSLTLHKTSKSPVSLTTITAENIAHTPARDLADLIEIYVPGALFLNHTVSHVGLRGMANNSNYLLLVNGIDNGFKIAHGALLDLSNWDLNDIERIEIIRGPGSVIYGPNALSGIIKITTKTALTSEGLSVGAESNLTYRSTGAFVEMGYQENDFNLYGYGSIRYSGGYEDADFFAINPNTGESGYIDTGQGEGVVPLYGDNQGKPQVKLHLDANLFKEWRLWIRYSNSDRPALFQQRTMVQSVDGVLPYWFSGQEGVVSALENNHSFNENVTLDSKVSFSSKQYYDYWITHPDKHYDEGGFNSPYGAGNIIYGYSESNFLFSSMARINQFDNKLKLAVGAEYDYIFFNPPWGKDKMYLLSNDYQTPDGRYIEDMIAKGFETNTISLLGEGNLQLFPAINLLLSARVDKNNFSKYFFSPRVGLISEVNKKNTTILIWQHSIKSAVFQHVYQLHLNNTMANPEILNSFQVMHNYLPTSNILANISASYNWIEMIGFVYDRATIKGYHTPIGKLKYFTIEAEVKYNTEKFISGINHSFVKQINWKNAPGVTAQGISYSDYNENGLISMGNDLNNWANNSTKLFANIKLPYHFTFHTDAQIFWKWEGYKDARKMYSSKYVETDPGWNLLNERLLAEDFAGTDIRINVSVSKYFSAINSTLTIYGSNLLGSRRYSFSTGERFNYPSRIMWVNEPTALGIKMKVTI
jgi:hypothetical protein